jgi:hypothetical protein
MSAKSDPQITQLPAPLFSTLDVGSMAVLVVVLVQLLSLVIRLGLFLRHRRAGGEQELHCARWRLLPAALHATGATCWWRWPG